MAPIPQLTGIGTMPASNGTTLASNGNILPSNGTTAIDQAMSINNNNNTMALLSDARIILPILVIVLGIILRIYQILIAKRTLAVFHDIKEGRNA
ncbi:hypothetical protein B0A55_07242 [Friedmanniomyces simplex]|uniref:Uncharacterized protein n=1 Tax=Friedmanniomyces simplex TaxID=329884 RepID=A0A4U0X800_9PEZI|nr:hypothetical protein B0A55_07242 [Friedmanniomyces simplex]